jgi:hypothetical protein
MKYYQAFSIAKKVLKQGEVAKTLSFIHLVYLLLTLQVLQ